MELSKLIKPADPATNVPVSVELPSMKGQPDNTVLVRRLSRGETMDLMEMEYNGGGKVKLPTRIWEQRLLAAAMVDPKMTEADVKEWQENGSSGDIEAVTSKIQELANISATTSEEAAKSA